MGKEWLYSGGGGGGNMEDWKEGVGKGDDDCVCGRENEDVGSVKEVMEYWVVS